MSRRRILLADDHQGVVSALIKLLSPSFEIVGIAEDGIAMVNAAIALKPDLIVADVSMPRLDGLGALAQLKQTDPDVKVVFMTMHHDALFATLAMQAGAVGVVPKHAASAELIPAIENALS